MIEHFERRDVAPFVVDQIYLGQRNHAVARPEQFENAQMLFTLRLPSFGGRNHEQARIDTAHTGEHVAQKTNVSGNVDEADALAGWQHRMGEAEVDGEPASLLFGKAIWVGARKRQNQRALAVVNVTRGGNNAHWCLAQCPQGVDHDAVVFGIDAAQIDEGATLANSANNWGGVAAQRSEVIANEHHTE